MPLAEPAHIAALARTVVMGGAGGVRIEGLDNIAAVRRVVDRPMIGLVKARGGETDVYITPTLADALAVIAAGADIVAFDATHRARPADVAALCAVIRDQGRLSMADVSTADEGKTAIEAGADIISTTLSGYTPYSRQLTEPDFSLMEELSARGVPFAAEGRIWSTAHAMRAFELGAAFVVIGGAISRPDAITRRFVDAVADTSAHQARGSISR